MDSTEERFACTVTVGQKGQIVLPGKARKLMHIEPGDTLILLCDANRGMAIPPKEKFLEVQETVFGGGK